LVDAYAKLSFGIFLLAIFFTAGFWSIISMGIFPILWAEFIDDFLETIEFFFWNKMIRSKAKRRWLL